MRNVAPLDLAPLVQLPNSWAALDNGAATCDFFIPGTKTRSGRQATGSGHGLTATVTVKAAETVAAAVSR